MERINPRLAIKKFLTRTFVYNNRKNCKTNSISMDRSHVYDQTSYMKSISNCNLKTDAPYQKKKILHKQCNQKTDASK